LVVVVVLLAFSVCVTTREAIPDRARFIVRTKERYIVPRPVPGQNIFHSLSATDDDDVLVRFDAVVTWGDLRQKDHPYHKFDLPKTPEWDKFRYYGREVSLLRSTLFPEESRWDETGRKNDSPMEVE
jgi:hypothetical protein